MPHKSKLAISCIQNLGSSAKKWSSVTIEDVEDEGELPYNQSSSHSDQRDLEADEPITIIGYLDDLEEELLPDLISDIPNQDSDSEVDDKFEEIREVLDLEMFANTLAEAQRVAVETEDKRLKEYNHPKHYLGNSARSKQHHRQIGRELKAKGYHLIKEWFAKQNKNSASRNASCNADVGSDEVQDSDCKERSTGTGHDGEVDDNKDPGDIDLV